MENKDISYNSNLNWGKYNFIKRTQGGISAEFVNGSIPLMKRILKYMSPTLFYSKCPIIKIPAGTLLYHSNKLTSSQVNDSYINFNSNRKYTNNCDYKDTPSREYPGDKPRIYEYVSSPGPEPNCNRNQQERMYGNFNFIGNFQIALSTRNAMRGTQILLVMEEINLIDLSFLTLELGFSPKRLNDESVFEENEININNFSFGIGELRELKDYCIKNNLDGVIMIDGSDYQDIDRTSNETEYVSACVTCQMYYTQNRFVCPEFLLFNTVGEKDFSKGGIYKLGVNKLSIIGMVNLYGKKGFTSEAKLTRSEVRKLINILLHNFRKHLLIVGIDFKIIFESTNIFKIINFYNEQNNEKVPLSDISTILSSIKQLIIHNQYYLKDFFITFSEDPTHFNNSQVFDDILGPDNDILPITQNDINSIFQNKIRGQEYYSPINIISTFAIPLFDKNYKYLDKSYVTYCASDKLFDYIIENLCIVKKKEKEEIEQLKNNYLSFTREGKYKLNNTLDDQSKFSANLYCALGGNFNIYQSFKLYSIENFLELENYKLFYNCIRIFEFIKNFPITLDYNKVINSDTKKILIDKNIKDNEPTKEQMKNILSCLNTLLIYYCFDVSIYFNKKYSLFKFLNIIKITKDIEPTEMDSIIKEFSSYILDSPGGTVKLNFMLFLSHLLKIEKYRLQYFINQLDFLNNDISNNFLKNQSEIFRLSIGNNIKFFTNKISLNPIYRDYNDGDLPEERLDDRTLAIFDNRFSEFYEKVSKSLPIQSRDLQYFKSLVRSFFSENILNETGYPNLLTNNGDEDFPFTKNIHTKDQNIKYILNTIELNLFSNEKFLMYLLRTKTEIFVNKIKEYLETLKQKFQQTQEAKILGNIFEKIKNTFAKDDQSIENNLVRVNNVKLHNILDKIFDNENILDFYSPNDFKDGLDEDSLKNYTVELGLNILQNITKNLKKIETYIKIVRNLFNTEVLPLEQKEKITKIYREEEDRLRNVGSKKYLKYKQKYLELKLSQINQIIK